MSDLGGGIGLPQMSEREMFENLLGEDSERDGEEPAIAARIGEQMLHMNLQPLPRSTRVRIRDIISRIPACRSRRWRNRTSFSLVVGSMVR